LGEHLAVIDVGSNTIHLLVGTVEGGLVLPRASEKVSVRLGEGVERTGRLQESRLQIAVAAIDLFARISALHGAVRPEIVATSAVREAVNGRELIRAVQVLSGLEVRLLSGEEEAVLGFRGAMSAVRLEPGAPVLVVDLGGGSAQFIFGGIEGPECRVSLPLGTGRITERFVTGETARREELERVREHVLAALPDWELPEGTVALAVGGSARAMLKSKPNPLTPEALGEVAAEVGERTAAVYARERGLSPVRARVLPAAAATLGAVLERFGLPHFTVVRGGVREGVLLTAAMNGEVRGWRPE
jgi:exopolyphosphatase/guanosine-5'-triphosphate,3'-diphosphate pyrophosphatase